MHSNRSMLGLLLTCTVALSLSACSGAGRPAASPEPEKYQVAYQLDLEYAQPDGKPLLLDVWRPDPAPRRPMPAVIWVHGGGWSMGSRKDNPSRFLAEAGYFTVSIDHRRAGDAVYPAQLLDLKAAVRWLRSHAKEYNVDPNRIGVWGHSSGGHLAALLGTTGGVAEFDGTGSPSTKVQAVVDLAGPIDLLQTGVNPESAATMEARLLGGPLKEQADAARRANPVTYVSEDDPPFLILHGAKDTVVALKHGEVLDAALRQAGVESTLAVIPEVDHSLVWGATAVPPVAERVLAFFDKHLKQKR